MRVEPRPSSSLPNVIHLEPGRSFVPAERRKADTQALLDAFLGGVRRGACRLADMDAVIRAASSSSSEGLGAASRPLKDQTESFTAEDLVTVLPPARLSAEKAFLRGPPPPELSSSSTARRVTRALANQLPDKAEKKNGDEQEEGTAQVNQKSRDECERHIPDQVRVFFVRVRFERGIKLTVFHCRFPS